MATKRIQISCPNCRLPITADSQQIFDVAQEPDSKQRMLSGAPNVANCPHCGFQGPFHIPVAYHDPSKELLLIHVPQELGLPMHEQERVIGPLITKVVDSLPQEARKAYLLQPKTMLTMQTMVETILEGDGVTKEMMRSQQEKVQLLQTMARISDEDALVEIAKQEDSKIDQEFFQILSTLINQALAGGQEALARRLADVQNTVVNVTTYGQKIQEQSREMEEAARALQDLGQNATREDLLNLVIKATSETQVQAYVSMARGGMDYQFFQMLSDRVDRARGDGRKRLSQLREQLLELTRQYDEQSQQQIDQTKQDIESVIQQEDVQEALLKNPAVVTELFFQLLHSELEEARKSGNLLRSGKLQQVIDVIQELSAPPPGTELINRLVEAQDDAELAGILDDLSSEELDTALEMMTNLVAQVENSADEETAERIRNTYRKMLRHSMRQNMNL